MMTKPELARMDVFYVNDNVIGFTAAGVDVFESWDGSLFAETNVRCLCGPNRLVYLGDSRQVASIDGEKLHSPASWHPCR